MTLLSVNVHASHVDRSPVVPIQECGYDFVRVESQEQLAQVVREVRERGACAIDTETTGLDVLGTDTIIGLSISTGNKKAYYIPYTRAAAGAPLGSDTVVAGLASVFADESIKKYLHNAKFDMSVLGRAGMPIAGLAFDTMVAAWLVGIKGGLKDLSQELLRERMLTFKEVVFDAGHKDFSTVDPTIATAYAAADALQTWRLVPMLKETLALKSLADKYEQVENPLICSLYNMESRGLVCDGMALRALLEDAHFENKKIIRQLIDAINPDTRCLHILGSPTHVVTGRARRGLTALLTGAEGDDARIRAAIKAPEGYRFVGTRIGLLDDTGDVDDAYKKAVVLFDRACARKGLNAHVALQVADELVVAAVSDHVEQAINLMGTVIDGSFCSCPTGKRRRQTAECVFKVGQTWAQVG